MHKPPPTTGFFPCVLLAAAVASAFQSGCGYMVGNGFGPEIRTVSVPLFQNNTYRRNIEYQLTEAVQKEIQNRTPFRLAGGDAQDQKRVMTPQEAMAAGATALVIGRPITRADDPGAAA